MKPIDVQGFERKFQESLDPWHYRTSRFEARKRLDLLLACGPGMHGRGLELACAIGETSRVLASRCLTLLAVDGAPTALAEARRLTDRGARIQYRQGMLPHDVPSGPFDLVVVSEIAYYLSPRDLAVLARRLVRATAPGGRIVVLHHVVPFADAAQLPALAQANLCRCLRRSMKLVQAGHRRRYQFAAFRKSIGRATDETTRAALLGRKG